MTPPPTAHDPAATPASFTAVTTHARSAGDGSSVM